MKEELLNLVILNIEEKLFEAKKVLEASFELVKSGDLKSESKWDTRGIEAGYLASAQERRFREIELELLGLKNLKDKKENKNLIGIGSIVETEDKNYFITPTTGGIKIELNKKLYHIISIGSPMAKKLLDEEIEIIDFF